MWQRDFPGVYDALKKDWANGLQPLMDAVLGESNLVHMHVIFPTIIHIQLQKLG
jgi:hypothetical protein